MYEASENRNIFYFFMEILGDLEGSGRKYPPPYLGCIWEPLTGRVKKWQYILQQHVFRYSYYRVDKFNPLRIGLTYLLSFSLEDLKTTYSYSSKKIPWTQQSYYIMEFLCFFLGLNTFCLLCYIFGCRNWYDANWKWIKYFFSARTLFSDIIIWIVAT